MSVSAKSPRSSHALDLLISALAVAMTGLCFYTYVFGLLPAMQQRSMFLAFVLSLILLMEIRDKWRQGVLDLLAVVLLCGSLCSCAYLYFNWHGISFRLVSPERLDIALGILLLAAILKGTNRKLGMALPLITLVFILYALLGSHIPGDLSTSYFPVQRVTAHLTMETSGVFGIVLGTAAKYIFIFVIFGAFLEHSGASAFFLDLTDCLLGRAKGSGAKVDAMSSALFGMVSGSAVANVMATGPMTVPMMRKNGFGGYFAGSVSSIAGTGGQLMPPIMGTAAFIIAETLAVPYSRLTLSALIPGLLFYLTLWMAINFHANKLGMRGSKEKRDWRPVLRRGYYYIIPLCFLIATVTFLQWSPIKAGIWSTALVILCSQFSRENRMGIKKILLAMEHAAYNVLSVGVACATAGIIIGVLSLTGLGLKFSGLLVTLSGGNMAVLLVFTMISGLVLGMGMTTTSVYIVLSVLVAPALVSFGVSPVAAHLFVFYFGILSCITPPVSTAVFAAASIAKVSPMRLGAYTTRTAIPIYLIPFLFVLNPQLLMVGTPPEILLEFLLSALSLCALSAAIEGCCFAPLAPWERAVLALCSLCMLQPALFIEIGCNAVILILFIKNYIGRKSLSRAVER